jgi:hypothetical protein
LHVSVDAGARRRRAIAWTALAVGAALILRAAVHHGRAVSGPSSVALVEEPHPLAPPRVAPPTPLPPGPRVTPPAGRLAVGAAVMAIKKRNLLIAAHDQQLLEQADEQAFDALDLPAASRALLRAINDRSAEDRRALLGAEISGRTSEDEAAAAEAGNAALDRDRRAKLVGVLGVDQLGAFEAAESEALAQLRRRFPGWDQRVGSVTTTPLDLAAR